MVFGTAHCFVAGVLKLPGSPGREPGDRREPAETKSAPSQAVDKVCRRLDAATRNPENPRRFRDLLKWAAIRPHVRARPWMAFPRTASSDRRASGSNRNKSRSAPANCITPPPGRGPAPPAAVPVGRVPATQPDSRTSRSHESHSAGGCRCGRPRRRAAASLPRSSVGSS